MSWTDRRTDRRTDRQNCYINIALTRDKNRTAFAKIMLK